MCSHRVLCSRGDGGPCWQAQREGLCDLDFKPNLNVAIEGGATSQESRSSGVQARELSQRAG